MDIISEISSKVGIEPERAQALAGGLLGMLGGLLGKK